MKSIQNKHVHVVWMSAPETVMVMSVQDGTQYPFAGFDGLNDMYESFHQSFSEQTDFATTINFFKPNIQPTKVL